MRIPTTWQDYFSGFKGRIRSEGLPAKKRLFRQAAGVSRRTEHGHYWEPEFSEFING